ncbi:MAG: flagellar hook-basal body complex protein [Terracidiphilus sp.]|jgi:flagellar hook protein FlgE
MPNFYIPLSGLNSDSTALNTIANNLSNMNTTGFKSQTTNFSDLFYQQVGTTGSGDEIQQGTGVQVASNSTDFTGGSISSTGVETDAAIDGSGFFVLDAGSGSQLYTRDGNFQVSSTGTLESTEGQAVMGYLATNGVISTAGGLADLSVPTGQVMQPSATTSMSMTQNLDSTSAVGAQATGQVKVFDSLGKSYEATVTYTNLGANKWSYAVTLPDTLSAAATAAAATTLSVTQALPAATLVPTATTSATAASTTPILLAANAPVGSTISTNIAQNNPVVAAPNTTYSYTLAPTGLMNGSSTLSIVVGGQTITVQPSSSDEDVASYAADLNKALNGTGITVTGTDGTPSTNTAGTLSFKGLTSSNFTVGGTLQQDVPMAKTSYNFGSYTDPTTGSATLAAVDPSTSLQISEGALGPVSVPPFTVPQSISSYAQSLQSALTGAGITDITVSGTNGVLSITGPSNMKITNALNGLTSTGPAFVNQDTLGTIVTNTVTPQAVATTTPVSDNLTPVAGTPSTNSSALISGSASLVATSSPAPAPTVTQGVSVNDNVVTPDTTTLPGGFIYSLTTDAAPNATTVGAGTNVVFSWTPAAGPAVTATAAVPAPPTPANYATALNTALTSGSMAASGATAAYNPATGQITVTASTAGSALTVQSGAVTQDFTGTTSSYSLTTSNGAVAAVDKSTNLTFTWTDPAGNVVNTTAPSFGANSSESLATYAAALNTSLAGISGATATVTGTGQITISGPSSMTVKAGSITQDFTGTSIPYSFAMTGTVATNSNLKITLGGTTTPPVVFTGTPEDGSAYAVDLNTAIGKASLVNPDFVGVSASFLNGQLTITGPTNISTTGSLEQNVAMATKSFNLASSNGAIGLVDPSTTFSISEQQNPPTTPPTLSTAAPIITSDQSITSYASTLQSALTSAGITDVTVTGDNATGQLSIKYPSSSVASNGDPAVTFGGNLVQNFNATTTNFDLGTYTDPNTGLTSAGLVGAASNLKISGVNAAGATVTTAVITPPNGAGVTVGEYAAQVTNALTNAGITGVTVSANSVTGQLTFVGPSSLNFTGSVSQNLLGTTTNYAFQSGATVDPTTDLVITGETSSGTTARINTPQVSAGETVAQYATALTAALTTAGIANVKVTATNGQLAISGANVNTSGNLVQGLADSTINYNFGSSATVNPATSLTIVGPTVSGSPATAVTTAPAVTAGETVAEYAAALNQALASANIITGVDGVSVTANGGLLSIQGPASVLKVAGIASQDLTASKISYDFGTSGNAVAAVDPTTNLTITGLTASGQTATTIAPTVTPGESLVQYVNDLTTSLTAAGIAGVTVSSTAGGQLSITGANLSTSGSVIQDPVSSTNSTGTLTFDANGNLVNPTANLTNVTFAGLSDSAATMNMSWDLFGASGAGVISQTAAATAQSGQTQNGYSSGEYQSFTIGSSGTITAVYSNGQNQTVGQLGIASMSNLQGLVDVGSTEYQTTTASGSATVGVAGTGGLGTLQGSSLEASNVNISAQFSDLIVAQRAFEANAKSVTTFDTITQETINMIH